MLDVTLTKYAPAVMCEANYIMSQPINQSGGRQVNAKIYHYLQEIIFMNEVYAVR